MTPELLSLSNAPGMFVAVMLVKILAVFTVVMLMVAYATWLERKLIGHMQTRLGPTMTGWFGLLLLRGCVSPSSLRLYSGRGLSILRCTAIAPALRTR